MAKKKAALPVNTGEPINPVADALKAASTEDVAPANQKPRRRKRTQPDLPGVSGPGVAHEKVPEIDDAAEEYVSARDRRQAMTIEEVNAKTALLATMHAHKLDRYRYEDSGGVFKEVAVIKPGEEKVKVSKVKVDVEVESEAEEA